MPTVSEALAHFFNRTKDPILFAGAGVSSRAGIPVWGELLERLRQQATSADPLTAAHMGEKIRQGKLTMAAEYLLMSDQILEGDKYKWLAAQLRNFDLTPLRSLASLPFRAYLLTSP